MRAHTLTLLLIAANLVQTPVVHAAARHVLRHPVTMAPHLHHLGTPLFARHPDHLIQTRFASSAPEQNTAQSSTFSVASYVIGLFGPRR